jgi:hypothetical protein
VQSGNNLADMLTKPLNGPTLHNLMDKVLYLSNVTWDDEQAVTNK